MQTIRLCIINYVLLNKSIISKIDIWGIFAGKKNLINTKFCLLY